jgi:hypothetical protein
MIRSVKPEDLGEIRRIYDAHFKEQFDPPDFMNFICAFVIEDEQGIITAGGIRDIAECVAVTDMNRPVLDRSKALYRLLDASVFVCKQWEYDRMYAWSQSPSWAGRLKKEGFRPHQGQSLILDL